MMDSRFEIFYGIKQSHSPEFLLSCNFWTEGCGGGWPILTMIFANAFHLVSSECASYAVPDVPSCDTFSECEPIATVSEYGFVGGAYGAGSEAQMMKELRARGPITAEFEPGMSFFVYDSGIYVESEAEDAITTASEAGSLSHDDLEDYSR